MWSDQKNTLYAMRGIEVRRSEDRKVGKEIIQIKEIVGRLNV